MGFDDLLVVKRNAITSRRQENEKRIVDGRMTFNTEINDCRESGDFIFSYPLSMIIFSAWRTLFDDKQNIMENCVRCNPIYINL